MHPIIDTPFLWRFILALMTIVINVFEILLFFRQQHQHRKWRYYITSLIMIVFGLFLYETLREVLNVIARGDEVSAFWNFMNHIPAEIYAVVITIMFIIAISSYVSNKLWQRRHINPKSINESFDRLPIGLCYYHDSGVVKFLNTTMCGISYKLTGRIVNNGKEFWDILINGLIDESNEVIRSGSKPIIKLKNNQVFAFYKRVVQYESRVINEIQAVDITEEYQITQVYNEEKKRMTEINERLKDYSQKVIDVTIEREILEAKVKIHDDLGHALIMTKRYLTEGDVMKDALVELWNRNIALLKATEDEKKIQYSEEFDSLLYIAECSGISVVMNGSYPSDATRKRIINTAFSEFLTNTYRHGHGDEISIYFLKDRTIFRNNGDLPTGEMKERGGLANLRKIVEESGYQMRIEAKKNFQLVICHP